MSDITARIEELTRRYTEASRKAGQKGEAVNDLRLRLEEQDKANEKMRAEFRRLSAEEAAILHASPPPPPPEPQHKQHKKKPLAEAQGPRNEPSSQSTNGAAQSHIDADVGHGLSENTASSARTSDARSRPARVIIGACMPYGLQGGAAAVLKQVCTTVERIATFAEVRLVLTKDLIKADGADTLEEEVRSAVQSARATLQPDGVNDDPHTSSAPSAVVFTCWDMENQPHHCAAELARWADILLIAPLCTSTLTSMSIGMANDLLLELVQVWPRTQWRGKNGMRVPKKGFVVCPRMPQQRRNNPVVEEQLEKLLDTGIEVMMADPDDETVEEQEPSDYVEMAVERVKQLIQERQANQAPALLERSPAPVPAPRVGGAGGKRRRAAEG